MANFFLSSAHRQSRIVTSFVASRAMSMSHLQPDFPHSYHPPRWAEGKVKNVPEHGRLHLANLPTPLHLVGAPKNRNQAATTSPAIDNKNINAGGILSRLEELNIKLYMKRDDATGGVELGGNKVRKLEFLLADALAKGCDSVVTIGGEQSNHCRATAAARSVLCSRFRSVLHVCFCWVFFELLFCTIFIFIIFKFIVWRPKLFAIFNAMSFISFSLHIAKAEW